ncbi:DEAD/DEAH box helicase [Phycisphaerales bacterium AB-hyl4]|uniref:DEAD/DEAH box helicase n=1 Tax=Natronomicrosphaera hydrolytica TaxID=3242702 RepID=A0ABV4UAD1_9BACT
MPKPSRDDLLLQYLDRLPYEPYPVQEEALMRYFESDEGVLVCAPTGMGKTLIAEAALYEALSTGRRAYYTTPLIALTEQKFTEVQDAAERWGFSREQVGLVTGNRSVNPRATVLVVVAEILLNRLLHKEAFDFSDVSAVVMDEFHSFAEPERGIVWELSLSLLPKHVRLLLLSATVGNASQFLSWLRTSHGRDLTLAQSKERKVPLTCHWVGEQLLPELLIEMVRGEEQTRKTPALVFCFDRERCWAVGELLRGKDMLNGDQQAQLAEQLDAIDFSQGAGPKLKRILMRGVGIHHAGLLPRYRRVVETLFQQKLLSVCVCTETLAAGINLPARSVVLTTLLKGPRGKKKLIGASSAHQMFGRAGRPQFDREGHVYAVAHEDDVKILRHKQKIEQIPEDTKDPQLMKMRKKLVKKTPTRREGEQYWSEAQFEKLQAAEPGKLESRGELPWRLLAFLLDSFSDVATLRDVVSKRLMSEPQIAQGQKQLTRMLVTLHEQGYVTLTPTPPLPRRYVSAHSLGWYVTLTPTPPLPRSAGGSASTAPEPAATPEPATPATTQDLLAGLQLGGAPTGKPAASTASTSPATGKSAATAPADPIADYQPTTAHATDKLKTLLAFRAVQPVYGAFLLDYLGQVERHERMQILESLLEMPGSVARSVRVPFPQDLPPGEFTRETIDPAIVKSGLATYDEMYPPLPHEQDRPFGEPPQFPIPLAEKMHLLFQSKVRNGGRVRITPVWAAGDLLTFNGEFNAFITARDLTKQEGMIFRHVLRLILLCEEFMPLTPTGMTSEVWQSELKELVGLLTDSCRSIDPACTDEVLARGD